MDFGYAIDSPGSLYGDIGRWIPRRFGTKSTNGTWAEDTQLVHLGKLHHIVKTLYIHFDGQWYVLFKTNEHQASLEHSAAQVTTSSGRQSRAVVDC